MVTADVARTPTFTMFANPDYFLFAGAPNCNSPCLTEQPGVAWNHGDVASDINTTWLGMVGPGVKQLGVDDNIWSDHTDTRPTMLMMLGLQDDYSHDGRVLSEALQGFVLPNAVKKGGIFDPLAEAYKAINAPVGPLGLATLSISTKALESGNLSDDSTYNTLENQLISTTNQRNAIAGSMIALLERCRFPRPGKRQEGRGAADR